MASPLVHTTALLESGSSRIDRAIARSMGRTGTRLIAPVPREAGPKRFCLLPSTVVVDVAAALRAVSFNRGNMARADRAALLNESRAGLPRHAESFRDLAALEHCLSQDQTCGFTERRDVPFRRTAVTGPDAGLRSLRVTVIVKPGRSDPGERSAGVRERVALGGCAWSLNDPLPSSFHPRIRLRRRLNKRPARIFESKLSKRCTWTF